MDNFLRRIKYYGIGFGIGLLFVIFLFQQKGCSWTPGNRVKSAILERIVFIDSMDQAYISANKINAKDLQLFIENGTVSFLKSKRHGHEKLYHFHGKLKSKTMDCLIAYREKSVVVDVDFEQGDLKKYTPLVGSAKPFLYHRKNWFSGKWELYDLKGIVKSTAPEKITSLFLANGVLDCAKSKLSTQKPFAYIVLTNNFTKGNDQTIAIKTVWFQEKIDIKDIYLTESTSVNGPKEK